MRPLCHVCGNVNSLPFYVPDDVWKAIVPKTLLRAEMCAMCFARLADERIVAWDELIELDPKSLIRSRLESQSQVRLMQLDQPVDPGTFQIIA